MKKALFLGILTVLIFSSCKKEGLGGTASINGNVKHHDDPIANATVYIKYGAEELPGTSAADYDSQTTADSAGHFEFEMLEKGSYYLFGVGFDNTISDSVIGGIVVNLKKGESVANDIPVTE